jgi:hypothetical protein
MSKKKCQLGEEEDEEARAILTGISNYAVIYCTDVNCEDKIPL